MVDIKKITTEQRNERTKHIDILSTKEVLTVFNQEDKEVPLAVEKAIDQIALLTDGVVESIYNGGRLFYVGAGTSGRLGVLDASEIPPTFGVAEDVVIGIIAGGDEALRYALENVEDYKDEAINDLKKYNLNDKDFVVGITASGRTPYAVAAVEYANEIGAGSGCITTSINSEIAKLAKYPIEAITGPEPLTGSTRMKSGTAQKLILNMITTTAMVKLGKVYENLMIDVQISNEKLQSRAVGIIKEITGIEDKEAKAKLEQYRSVKKVIFSILTNIEDEKLIDEILNKHHGNIQKALKAIQK